MEVEPKRRDSGLLAERGGTVCLGILWLNRSQRWPECKLYFFSVNEVEAGGDLSWLSHFLAAKQHFTPE